MTKIFQTVKYAGIVMRGPASLPLTRKLLTIEDDGDGVGQLGSDTVEGFLGYTPVNKAGDTGVGSLEVTGTIEASAGITVGGTSVSLVGHSHSATDITSGTLATARLGSGTADSTKYLRGDQTWQTISIVTDHGALTGLADDDHTQYHTDARGDARYSQLGHTHAAADIISGTVATARLGSGTANASSVLRGDQSWGKPRVVDGASNVAHETVFVWQDLNSPSTGTLKITLPKAFTATMISLEIEGWDYSTSGYGAWTLRTGVYTFSDGYMHLASANLLGFGPFNQVRWGAEGSNGVLLLGDLTTQWHYAGLRIRVTAYLSNQTGWDSGWAASIISSETGITVQTTTTVAWPSFVYTDAPTAVPANDDATPNSIRVTYGGRYFRLGFIDRFAAGFGYPAYFQAGYTGYSWLFYNFSIQPAGGYVLLGSLDDDGSTAKLQITGSQSWCEQSSTSTVRPQAIFTPSWISSTDASRKAQLEEKVYDTSARTVSRSFADGTNGYKALKVITTAPADSSLSNGEVVFYDNGSGSLSIKLKDSSGTVRTGTVTLT